MTRLEVRNMPAPLIAGYLVDEFGGAEVEPAGLVTGNGWQVRLVPGEPAAIPGGRGHYRVPVLFLEVSGPNEAAAVAFLKQKTMRGGG